MEWLFWVTLVLVFYTYVGYFVTLNVLAPWVRRWRNHHQADDQHLPRVSMVISVHNEEDLISQRIDNFEALDYPADQLALLLGDDCSTDRTREIIREHRVHNPRIHLVEFDEHQGKTAVINALVPQCQGDIIAFSDANTFHEPRALRRMVRHFADRRIGSVCGRLVLRSETGINPDDHYWLYETKVKLLENDLGVVLGANGGIYALRRETFQPLKSSVTQIDDFIWPVRVYEQGYSSVYEPEAVGHEEGAPTVAAEFQRKARIGTGDYRALVECRRLLAPWKGRIAFAFWSHKVLRWFVPFMLLILLVSNAWLASRPWYRELFILQVAFYLCALLGWLVSRQKHLLARVLRLPYYFVASNLALLVGFFRCVTGRQRAAWTQKRDRPC